MATENFAGWWQRVGSTGSIDPIRLGATRDDIRGLFGDPDDTGAFPRRERLPGILRYGSVEFHFDRGANGGLTLIYEETEDGIPLFAVGRRDARVNKTYSRRRLQTTLCDLERAVAPFVKFAESIKSTAPGPYPGDDHVLIRRKSLNTGEDLILRAGDFRAAWALATGTGSLVALKRDLVRATVAYIRELAAGTDFLLNEDLEWQVMRHVLSDEA